MTEATVSSKLLVTALLLEERDEATFPLEGLVLEAWRHFPKMFGMRGHEQEYPDTTKAYPYVTGKNGLVERGMLNRKREELNLSVEGRKSAYKLAEIADMPAMKQVMAQGNPYALAEDLDRWLSYALSTDAVAKARQGTEREIESTDVFQFFQISSHSPSCVIEDARIEVAENVHLLERYTKGVKEFLLRNNRFTTPYDVSTVCRVHRLLEARFKTLLELIKRRNSRNLTAPPHAGSNGRVYVAKGVLA